jgi:two-component system, sensor histidine kinase
MTTAPDAPGRSREPWFGWLPPSRPGLAPTEGPQEASSADAPAPDHGGFNAPPERLRLLVIEDNRDYADSLATFFEILEHQVTVAYSGTAGLEAALHGDFDAIICDLGLPGLSGYEVAERLRQHPGPARVYLVAVTGYGDDAAREKTVRSGFDAHLVKPVEAAALLQCILEGCRLREE